jgi:hypothetical protein
MKYFYIIVVDALSMRLRPSIPTSPAQAAKRHTAAQLGRKDQRPVRTCASKPSRSRDPRPLLPRARSGPTCRTKHGNISAPPQGFRVRASHSLSLFSPIKLCHRALTRRQRRRHLIREQPPAVVNCSTQVRPPPSRSVARVSAPSPAGASRAAEARFGIAAGRSR